MGIKVETPPALRGQPESQIKEISSYLYRLAEMLNVALNNLNQNNFASATEASGEKTGTAKGQGIDTVASYNELRGLISNSAKVVYSTFALRKMQ